MWRLLHALAELRGTDTEWPSLLAALREGLPCPECAYHYNVWYTRHPLNGADVGEWLLALHNDVNRRNRKTEWSRVSVTAAVGAMSKTECVDLLGVLHGKIGSAAYDILATMTERL